MKNFLYNGSSLINEYIDLNDIKKYFYRLSDDNTQNIEHVFLSDYYSVVSGDYIVGIKHTTSDNENYYMFISANSFGAPPQQIAIGKSENGIIYLMQENFPNSHTINLVAFPETSINLKTKGFISKSYRETIRFIDTPFIDNLSEQASKCLESGLQASKVFEEVIEDFKKNNELNKRKKLNI